MALYRNQESIDTSGDMSQSTLDYFLEAGTESPGTQSVDQMSHPRVQHVSANSLCLLKQSEDQFGRPYKDCTQPD